MRTLLLLGLAIGGAFFAGWFTIERDGDRTRIEINKTEIRGDTRHAIDKGRDLLEQRERERLANQQQSSQGGFAPNQGQWPPQQAAPIQGAGFNGQNSFNNQPAYNQPAYNPPAYNQQFQAPNPNQQQRWTEMPPPWQQQTR